MSEGPKQAEVTVVQEKPKASTTAKAGVGLSIGALILLVFQMFGPMIMDALHVDKATQQKLIDAAKQLEEEQKKREEAEAKAEKLEQEKAAAVKPGPTILIEQPKPPVEKTSDFPPPKAIDPAIIQQWIDLFRQVVDNLPKPKPEPKPDPDPKPLPPNPKPEPPIPVPPNPPSPTPGTLRIALTDADQQEITSPTVGAGKLIVVRFMGASGPGSLTVLAHGPAQVAKVDANNWSIVLDLGSEVDCIGTEFGTQKQITMRVTCNKGPIPPPNPQPQPDPKPIPDDHANVKKPVGIWIVWDKGTVTPDQSTMIKDFPFWMDLQKQGNDWRTFLMETKDPAGQWAIQQMQAKQKQPPAIVFVDENRKFLDVIPMPSDYGTVKAAVARLSVQ